jgi:hypothetical protein
VVTLRYRPSPGISLQQRQLCSTAHPCRRKGELERTSREPGGQIAGRLGQKYRHPVRAQERHPFRDAPAGDGLRLRHELLAKAQGLVSALQSSTRGRPPFGLGRGGGNTVPRGPFTNRGKSLKPSAATWVLMPNIIPKAMRGVKKATNPPAFLHRPLSAPTSHEQDERRQQLCTTSVMAAASASLQPWRKPHRFASAGASRVATRPFRR